MENNGCHGRETKCFIKGTVSRELCKGLDEWRRPRQVAPDWLLIFFIYRNYLNFSSVVEKSEWATVWLRGPPLGSVSRHHGRIIYTEEKAKGQRLHPGGTELLQFLAPLAILHQDELKNRLICTLFFNSFWCKSTYSSNRPGAK